MRIFFYTAEQGAAGGEVATRLGCFSATEKVVSLRGKSLWDDPRSLELRDGDILILYAAGRAGMEALVAEREHFLEFRVVLLLPDTTDETLRLAALLNPRYMAGNDDAAGGLPAVLDRMTGKGRRDAARAGRVA